MTDLEITKLAAESVGKECVGAFPDGIAVIERGDDSALADPVISYHPLTDPAQAFELMENLGIRASYGDGDYWDCSCGPDTFTTNESLKRAIVECSARYALWKRGQK